MAESTVYDVKLVYSLQDSTASGLKGITSNAKQAADATDSLKGALGGLVGAMGAYVSVGMAKTAFVDFNRDVEMAKVNIAAVQRMFGQAPDMKVGLENAAGVFDRYQEAAKASTATTKEFMDMHLSLAPTFAKFGVGGKVIEDMVNSK